MSNSLVFFTTQPACFDRVQLQQYKQFRRSELTMPSIVEVFERKFLFGLARTVAIVTIFLLFGFLAIGGFVFSEHMRVTDSKVTADEVLLSLKNSDEPGEKSAPETLSGGLNAAEAPLNLPFVLQKHIGTPENLEILKSWLNGLSESEKKEFLDDLAQCVSAAEVKHEDIVQTTNKFKEIKLAKLAEKKAKETERVTYILYFTGLAATSLILIALLSLTLVLLAVERNTRRIEV